MGESIKPNDITAKQWKSLSNRARDLNMADERIEVGRRQMDNNRRKTNKPFDQMEDNWQTQFDRLWITGPMAWRFQ